MVTRGLCECGCDAKTTMSPYSHTAKGYVKGEPRRFLPGHWIRMNIKTGDQHPRWKGGTGTTGGYVTTIQHGHPRAHRRTGHVMQHILIAEAAVGAPLSAPAEVHHVNSNRADNAPNNLVVCQDHAYHMLLHRRQRAMDACGDPSAMLCRFCHRYDAPSAMRISVRRRSGRRSADTIVAHASCERTDAREYMRKYRRTRPR